MKILTTFKLIYVVSWVVFMCYAIPAHWDFGIKDIFITLFAGIFTGSIEED
jgi:hypothetical protein